MNTATKTLQGIVDTLPCSNCDCGLQCASAYESIELYTSEQSKKGVEEFKRYE